MALNRIQITNWDNWGKLVKSWTLGENRLPDLFVDGDGMPLDVIPAPADIEDFKAQCDRALIGLTLPANFTHLTVMKQTKDMLVLKLPPADLVRDSEEHLGKNGNYMLPSFYSDFLQRRSEDEPKSADPFVVAQHRAANFHTCRTGDYVIQLCM